MQRSLLGPQPDAHYHFAQRNIDADLYRDIMAVGGKLVTRQPGQEGTNYFKIPYASPEEQEVVNGFVERWNAALPEKYPLLVIGGNTRFVQPALRRLGGVGITGPDGEFIGFVIRELESPAAPAADRFRLAQHVTGVKPDPDYALEVGARALTDRNAILVRSTLKTQFGAYYDPAAKASIIVPDVTLKPETAERDFIAAQEIVREARGRNPQEFDRLRTGLQIAIEAGLGSQIFKGETVNSLDDLAALDYGQVEFIDALATAKRVYRALIQVEINALGGVEEYLELCKAGDPECHAFVLNGKVALTLETAMDMAMGVERETIGLDSVINVEREENRDQGRSVGAAAYRASADLVRIAERFASNARHADGRMTDSELLAEKIQQAVNKYDAKDISLYTIAKNTVSYGPILTRDGDRFVQLVATNTGKGIDAELVVHDLRALVDVPIVHDERESVSIGHLLKSAALDKVIADKTNVALVSHGGVTFALSASKLGVQGETLSQAALEKIFGEAVTGELEALSKTTGYFTIKERAERAAGTKPIPPAAPELPENATAFEKVKAQRANEARANAIASNQEAIAERRAAEATLVSDAKLMANGLIADRFHAKPSSLTVRGPAHNPAMTAELVAVFSNGEALLFAEIVPKLDARGFRMRGADKKPMFEVPQSPSLTMVDAREHVRIIVDAQRTQNAIANPYVLMSGTNRDGSERNATPLTVGVSRGEIVTSRLTGQNMQALLDSGYVWHQNREPQVNQQVVKTQQVRNLDPELGKSGEIKSFDSDRDAAIETVEMQLREEIAAKAGLNLHAKRDSLMRLHPAATLRDAAVALGITVTAVDSMKAPKMSIGEEGSKAIMKAVASTNERTGAGIDLDNFFPKDDGNGTGGMHVAAAPPAAITGTIVAYSGPQSFMFVHQHIKASGLDREDQHRLYRIDYPQAFVPIFNGNPLGQEERMAALEVGKTVRLSFDPSGDLLEPTINIVDKEIEKLARLEKAEQIKEAQLQGKSADRAELDATVANRAAVIAKYAERAFEDTPFNVHAMRLAPIDTEAVNRGFLFATKAGTVPVVFQVVHDGPGSKSEPSKYRMFDDVDLYLRVASPVAGKDVNRGMFASIKIDDNRPVITTALTSQQFQSRENDMREQEKMRELDAMRAREEQREKEEAQRADAAERRDVDVADDADLVTPQ